MEDGMRHLESQLQQSLVAIIRMDLRCRNIFAIPNGGIRNIRTAVRLKKEGVLAGVPDLFLPVARGKFNGLFIELKTDKGVLSPSQKIMGENFMGLGYAVIVVRSVDEGRAKVAEYLALKKV